MEANLVFAEIQFTERPGINGTSLTIFNRLKSILQSRDDVTTKSVTLAMDILTMGKLWYENDSNITSSIFSVVLEIGKCIPPEHPWQDSLVGAISRLRERECSFPHMPTHGAEFACLNDGIEKRLPEPAARLGEKTMGQYARWINLNSFVARLVSAYPAPDWWHMIKYAFWQLRVALEEPPGRGVAEEYRLLVACEWILHCDAFLYQVMSAETNAGGSEFEFRTGSLCAAPSASTQRWNFWKTQFANYSADAKKLGLGPDVVARISDALRKMEAIGSN
ncbi:hypothetical protein F4802DRAFT_54219 [Xylaria palmicola]|nr:hypothetical protein F4802DRAFT_54219 [Xylaria palmicola]